MWKQGTDTSDRIERESTMAQREYQNIHVDEYLERVLEQAMQQEEEAVQTPQKPLSQEQLARVLQVSEQISQSTQGQVFEDPVEVIRKMREERLQELETNLTGYIA
jgi:hypothetical protein